MRDDFTAKTLRVLAARVGYHCSNPGCKRPTAGPALDESDIVNIGVAAHITAASPGTDTRPGPRYDKSLTSEERTSASNGIWLCQNCAKLIDSDIPRFPVELLRKWKQNAVDRAFTAVATSTSSTPPFFQLDEIDREFLRDLALPSEDDIESTTTRMQAAAVNDITAFRNAREWPSYVIPLNLTILDTTEQTSIAIEGIARAVHATEGVCLVSPPGTGKTTTQVQLADSILTTGQAIAALVPLGEWSDRLETFFEFLVRRNAFRSFRPQHFMQLAYHGRLVLLLDGWNELNPTARIRAEHDLTTLQREFPLLGIVIGTRRQARPIPGAIVEIQALSDDQQLALAHQLRGKEGEALVDQAWRTPDIHELISIPLYLNALLNSVSGTYLPKTKEEILNTFIIQHEKVRSKAEILHAELHGFHKDMLIGLAVEATSKATTNLPEADARRAVNRVVEILKADGQLNALEPTKILDTLVNTHALVRAAGGSNLSFQHHQFQEWYASFEVERIMIDAAQDNVGARNSLKNDILNWLAWEESVLFACERLSRTDADGSKAVAAAILDALGIDPMLAAEMIYRSAPEVWPHISEKVINFVQRWHKPGSVDRAVRFMITSGHPEFAECIWPLVTSSDSQIYLKVLRMARRFRPSVLGSDAAKRLAAIPEDIRRHVIAEIGQRSGFDGMELAASLAKSDKNSKVTFEIMQSLQFRHADRHVTDILQTASDEVWKLIAKRGYPETLMDAALNARLIEMRRNLAASETDPVQVIHHLTKGEPPEASAEERIKQLIQAPDFPVTADNARTVVNNTFKIFPEAVATAMLHRVIAGLPLPYEVDEYVAGIEPLDDGPIAAAAFDKATPRSIAEVVYPLVGPLSVGHMMDALFILNDEFHANNRQLAPQAREEHQRLEHAIASSRQSSFLPALLKLAETAQPQRIALMANLLSLHGGRHPKEPFAVGDDLRQKIAKILENWIKIMLTSPKANRHQFSEVVKAIERLPQPQFVSGVQKMLERDLADRARARAEYKKSSRRSSIPIDASHSYVLQYRGAFSAIGDTNVVALMKSYLPNLEFGLYAAYVLLDIWNREHPSSKEKSFGGWYDFSEIKSRRAQLQDKKQTPSTCDSAEVIFEIVRKLGITSNDAAIQQHALMLAKVGLNMPHGVKRSEIDTLLKLPLPSNIKRELLTAAALAGEPVPADLLLVGLRDLLEAAKDDPWGRLDENRGELMGWVELFPFSDRPTSIFEIIDMIPADSRRPWQLRRLLSALGNSPHEEALEVLQALQERDPEIGQEYDWLDALIKLGTEKSAIALLDLVSEGKLTGKKGNSDTWRLSEQLANFGQKFPALRDEMLHRYQKISAGSPRTIIEAALIKLADAPIILALIRNQAVSHQPYNGRLSKAVSKIAIGQRPVADWPGAYEQFSVPLVELRKELFAMLPAKDEQSALAEACLIKIEKLRDEHGRISDEPRHPDIASGRVWPKEVGEPLKK